MPGQRWKGLLVMSLLLTSVKPRRPAGGLFSSWSSGRSVAIDRHSLGYDPSAVVVSQPTQVGIVLPAASFDAGERVRAAFLSRLLHESFQGALEVCRCRRHGAVEKDFLSSPDEQGREVLDVQIAQLIGLAFDVQPVESDRRKLAGDVSETSRVFPANAAPVGTQADDPEFRGRCHGVRHIESGEFVRRVTCVSRYA